MHGDRGRFVGRGRLVRLRHLVVLVALAGSAGGCGATNPFVFRQDEFNRESPRFNTPLQVGEPVFVCYNGIGTTDLDVQKIAEARCAELGRAAKWTGSEFGRCPLLTPRAQIFRCVEVAGG